MGQYSFNTQVQDGGKSNPPKSKPSVYKLQSVIEHSGIINSGHYVAYRQGPVGSRSEQKWFKISDTNVEQTELGTVLRAKAYLLFYERVPEGAVLCKAQVPD